MSAKHSTARGEADVNDNTEQEWADDGDGTTTKYLPYSRPCVIYSDTHGNGSRGEAVPRSLHPTKWGGVSEGPRGEARALNYIRRRGIGFHGNGNVRRTFPWLPSNI